MPSRTLVATTLIAFSFAAWGQAEDDAKLIKLAGDKVVLEVPKEWKKEEPKSRIVQYEFSAPVESEKELAEEDKARITIMGAGGGVEANLDRWYGQFEQPGDGKTEDVAKVEEFEVEGQKIHYVDVTGIFKDTMGAGPFSGKPPVMREDYRMLGAIIETKDQGDYFVKITGPQELLGELEEGFKAMLKGLKSK